MTTGASGSAELDPLFLKALGYFWSKSPDSTAKLKKMLDDAIEQSQKKKQEAKACFDKTAAVKGTKHSVKAIKSVLAHDVKKKEKDMAQKRQFEKLQKDLEELDQEVSKKSKYDRSSSPASAFLSNDKLSLKQVGLNSESHAQRGSPLTSDDKDFALEVDVLACVICSTVSNSQGNTPVECQECHNMYHRECHQPPISYQDANDPRCVWYCARCTKNMKKVAKQNSSKSSSAINSNSARERLNSFESKNKSAFVTPFKRNEIKPTLQSSGNGSGGGSLSGWAALSGKTIQHPSNTAPKVPTSKTPTIGQQKPAPSSNAQSKEKREKVNKAPKSGLKLAVSDAWAEALGADLPPALTGSGKTSSVKSVAKSSPSWGANKSTIFPKAAATSVPSSGTGGKTGMTAEANAMKRLQMLKKKAKLNPKKSKV